MLAATDVLFVHTNFPGQYKLLARHLARSPSYRVAAIGSQTASEIDGVALHRYSLPEPGVRDVHSFAARFDGECRRAEQVTYSATILKLGGFSPRIIFAHPGWGETLPLREIFPDAKICVYCEFYYRTDGADVGFDREFPRFGVDGLVRIKARNAATLLALADADAAVAPTHWQKGLFPAEFQSKIQVIHDGIDVNPARAAKTPFVHASLGAPLTKADAVVTYVARSLEPYRGFHVFMRALPELLRRSPKAQICIAGDDGVSYGSPPEGAATWKQAMLRELQGQLDMSRVHFVGTLPHAQFQSLLSISRAHIYLTYPFVLSWSLLEAMGSGCVVIASNTDPVAEVITDGSNGLLVDFFDHAQLVDKVSEVIAAPERFTGMGVRARASALNYSFDRSSRPRLERLMRDLLEGATAHGEWEDGQGDNLFASTEGANQKAYGVRRGSLQTEENSSQPHQRSDRLMSITH
jgi:glycosyltransferase involved in cell wall biosynthesis